MRETCPLVESLGLAPHPLGGYFHTVHEVEDEGDLGRPVATVVLYLLTEGSPRCWFHRMRADAVHFFHHGGPMLVHSVTADGEAARASLGSDPAAGELFQLTVPGGVWKALELAQGPYSLISEAVAPGWIPEDNDLATDEEFRDAFPHLWPRLRDLVPAA